MCSRLPVAIYTTRHGGADARAFELYTTPAGQPDTVIGDLTQPSTLPTSRFDCFVCTQTFDSIYDVHAAVRGAAQLLSEGGHLLATVGGVSADQPLRHGSMGRLLALQHRRLRAAVRR